MITEEMRILTKLYPNITRGQIEVIHDYWRVFYENPEKYKGTELEKMVFEWLEGEGKEIVEWWNKETFM